MYHPNALREGQAALVDTGRTARFVVNLSGARGRYQVEWYRAYDGIAQRGPTVSGGEEVEFTAPWKGQDVVLRLARLR